MNRIIMITLAIMLMGTMLVAAVKPEPKKTDAPAPAIEECQEMGHMDMMKELGLNKTQTARLETLRDSQMKQMNSLKAEIDNLMIDMKASLKAEKYADAKAIQKQVFAKKLQKADARIDHMEAMMKELDPTQKEKAKAMFQNMHRGMQNGKMGMMRGGKGMGMHNMKDCDSTGPNHKELKEMPNKPHMNRPK